MTAAKDDFKDLETRVQDLIVVLRVIHDRTKLALSACASEMVVTLELFDNFLETLINYLCSMLKPLGKE